MGFSRALLYAFCSSVALSACAMCRALASKRPYWWVRLLGAVVVVATVLVSVQVRAYVQGLGVKRTLSATPNLLVHKVG